MPWVFRDLHKLEWLYVSSFYNIYHLLFLLLALCFFYYFQVCTSVNAVLYCAKLYSIFDVFVFTLGFLKITTSIKYPPRPFQDWTPLFYCESLFWLFSAAKAFRSSKVVLLRVLGSYEQMSVLSLNFKRKAFHLLLFCLTDWQGFAEQLFDKAGWHLSRNAQIKLVVSRMSKKNLNFS